MTTPTSKPLVIVESPAKAKTIGSLLGANFDVLASVGHIAYLPSKGMAVDVDNHFKPTYELTERGAKVIKELRVLAKKASAIYLATDRWACDWPRGLLWPRYCLSSAMWPKVCGEKPRRNSSWFPVT